MKLLADSMNLVSVTLGDFTFMNMEVPPHISMGGEHNLSVHDLVGGDRVVDALGATAAPLEWTGYFMGSNALERAKYLDAMRIKGKPLPLRWSSLNYTVLIKSFHYRYENQYRLPYNICCTVVRDNTQLPTELPEQEDWDETVRQLVTQSQVCVDSLMTTPEMTIIDQTVTTKPTTFMDNVKAKWEELKSFAKKVNNFIKATKDTIGKFKSMIKAVQTAVTRAIAALSNFLTTVTTLGGLLPFNPIAKNAAKMTSALRNVNNMFQLENLHNLLTNMDKSLAKIKSSSVSSVSAVNGRNISLPTTKTVHRANLYTLASMYYGDPMKWTLIAEANGLTAPYVGSPKVLTIPKEGGK